MTVWNLQQQVCQAKDASKSDNVCTGSLQSPQPTSLPYHAAVRLAQPRPLTQNVPPSCIDLDGRLLIFLAQGDVANKMTSVSAFYEGVKQRQASKFGAAGLRYEEA